MCKSVATTWMMEDACKALGYVHQWYHYQQQPTWDVATPMRYADIVVGCGRTAIEGLASGSSVLVFDGRQDAPLADGWVTADNVNELAERNFAWAVQIGGVSSFMRPIAVVILIATVAVLAMPQLLKRMEKKGKGQSSCT